MSDQPVPRPDRSPIRLRHEIRVRTLDVLAVERLSPSMIRLVLGGKDVDGFATQGFDDHVKMFFPDEGEGVPRLPSVGPNGIFMPEGQTRPIARDYTVRRHDPEGRRIQIDFVLHEDGPATRWAAGVRPGDKAWIAGPRGSFVIPVTFDWHLLIGDETALPAIARRIEELPAATRAIAVLEVEGENNRVPLATSADVAVIWAHRGSDRPGEPRALREALESIDWPSGDYHAWLGCESEVARSIRAWLIAERGANPKWLRASGYWRRGEAGYHDHHD